LEPELEVFGIEAEAGATVCVDDEEVELDCDGLVGLDVDGKTDVWDVEEYIEEGVDETVVEDDLDEIGVPVVLAAADVKVGLTNSFSVPGFGAQAIYE
jgi:hypothetical protein